MLACGSCGREYSWLLSFSMSSEPFCELGCHSLRLSTSPAPEMRNRGAYLFIFVLQWVKLFCSRTRIEFVFDAGLHVFTGVLRQFVLEITHPHGKVTLLLARPLQGVLA
jgi:hypothetical protein